MEIENNQSNQLKHMSGHRASSGNVHASHHTPYFSKPLRTVTNAMYDGNQYSRKEVGGRGGAYKFAAPPKGVAGRD